MDASDGPPRVEAPRAAARDPGPGEGGDGVAEALLAGLAEALGVAGLRYAARPEPLPGGGEATVLALRLAGTARAGGAARVEPDRPLVARLLPPGSDPRRATWEAAVQNAAADGGLPAPRALASGSLTHPTGAGGPEGEGAGEAGPRGFVLMERLPGRPILLPERLEGRSPLAWLALLAGAAGRLRRLPATLAELQLRLHALDPGRLERLGLPAELVTAEGRGAEIAAIVERRELDGLRPGLAWVRERLRAPEADPVLCHGDLLPVNVLASPQGRVTGLLDWSFARLAEPAFDVGSTRAILRGAAGALPRALRGPGRHALDRLAARYTAAYRRGRPLDPERIRVGEALRTLWELARIAERELDGTGGARPAARLWSRAAEPLCGRFAALTGVASTIPVPSSPTSADASRAARRGDALGPRGAARRLRTAPRQERP